MKGSKKTAEDHRLRRVRRLQDTVLRWDVRRLQADFPNTRQFYEVSVQSEGITAVHELTQQVAGKLRSLDRLLSAIEPQLHLDSIEPSADLEPAAFLRCRDEVSAHDARRVNLELSFRKEAVRVESELKSMWKHRTAAVLSNVEKTIRGLDLTLPRVDTEAVARTAAVYQEQTATNREVESWVHSELIELMNESLGHLQQEAAARTDLLMSAVDREVELLRREYEAVSESYRPRGEVSAVVEDYVVRCVQVAESVDRVSPAARERVAGELLRALRRQSADISELLGRRKALGALSLLQRCQQALEGQLQAKQCD